ncbi:phospholipid-binding protein MlaC [Pseudoruegeria sp. HB172150]|uniref:MlaC/ttg2D family ABC transporter substrate-binding protein n=1 Tax=Pseudoruegeria sp. HB172150 TaxID=2721164 RepID=UPI00155405BA|nr:ABC transporter substrate-binding protein [Pseudoruegeria sp. HB172150]
MSQISRRFLLISAAAASLLPTVVPALTQGSAQSLVDKAVADINRIIATGSSEAAMIQQFQGIFDRYADQPYIAAYAMGPDARRATPAQKAAFSDAFGRYLTAKYGRRFREFIGGKVVVTGAKPVKNWIEVYAQVNLAGKAPFAVTFYVSDRTGRDLFFNLAVEGVSMLLSEREEIGALLDKNRGDIDAMIAELRRLA